MSTEIRYDTVENYLKTYSTVEPPYDFNGLLHLVLAGIDNLRVNALEADFVAYAASSLMTRLRS